jgi:hypothetical protein
MASPVDEASSAQAEEVTPAMALPVDEAPSARPEAVASSEALPVDEAPIALPQDVTPPMASPVDEASIALPKDVTHETTSHVDEASIAQPEDVMPPQAALTGEPPSAPPEHVTLAADSPADEPSPPTDLPGARAYQSELQRKMTALTEDFSLGKINRRQFDAVYMHYREQGQIVDALIDSLNVDAWRKAISEGQADLLMRQNAARLLGHALYDNATGRPLAASDHFKIDPSAMTPIAAAQRAAGNLKTRIVTSELEGGQWLCCMPGAFSTLVALFSVEPARMQLQLLLELQQDFEMANAKRFRQGRGREVAEQFMQLWSLE